MTLWDFWPGCWCREVFGGSTESCRNVPPCVHAAEHRSRILVTRPWNLNSSTPRWKPRIWEPGHARVGICPMGLKPALWVWKKLQDNTDHTGILKELRAIDLWKSLAQDPVPRRKLTTLNSLSSSVLRAIPDYGGKKCPAQRLPADGKGSQTWAEWRGRRMSSHWKVIKCYLCRELYLISVSICFF